MQFVEFLLFIFERERVFLKNAKHAFFQDKRQEKNKQDKTFSIAKKLIYTRCFNLKKKKNI